MATKRQLVAELDQLEEIHEAVIDVLTDERLDLEDRVELALDHLDVEEWAVEADPNHR